MIMKRMITDDDASNHELFVENSHYPFLYVIRDHAFHNHDFLFYF